VALCLVVVLAVAFVFFVPIVYDPPFSQHGVCPYYSCGPSLPSEPYLVSITYFYSGYGGTYYFDTYQVYF